MTQLLIMQRELRELKFENRCLSEKAQQCENLERKVRELNYEIRDIQHESKTNRTKQEDFDKVKQVIAEKEKEISR